jgi:hypothetical protein
MSLVGHKQTFRNVQPMSALSPKAHINAQPNFGSILVEGRTSGHVALVNLADSVVHARPVSAAD